MGILPRRAPKAPGDLNRRLDIPAGERILAWGSGPVRGGDGSVSTGYLAATNRALYVEAIGQRLAWDMVSRASWEQPVLEVDLLDTAGQPAERLRLEVSTSGDLPAAVHDRVRASVMVSEIVEVRDGVRARMVARRASDDAAVRWSVVFETGVDATDPGLQEEARQALDALRSTLGI
jgi:hypothetical protein